MLFQFQRQVEKLTEHFLSRPGFVSISSESTNNIMDGSLLFEKWVLRRQLMSAYTKTLYISYRCKTELNI